MVEIAIQLLEALAAVHAEGIVHRDLKPSNIFLVRDRRQAVRIKLLDFGVAKVSSDTRLTEEGKVLGTPHFMSPEQVLGQEVDHRSDLWAVGVLLFTMLTGRRPFNGDSVVSVLSAIAFDEFPSIAALPNIPAKLNEIIERATASEASERYPSALGFAYDLEMMTAELGPARGQRISSTPPPADAAEYWELWTEGAAAGYAVETQPEGRAATLPPPLESTMPTTNEGLRGRSVG